MKVTETRKDGQVELRIAMGQANILVIISGKGGWKYGQREIPNKKPDKLYPWGAVDTSRFNVRLSMNGVVMLTQEEWLKLNTLISYTLAKEMNDVSTG